MVRSGKLKSILIGVAVQINDFTEKGILLPHNVRILRHSRHTERMYLGMIQLREVIKLDLHTLRCSVGIPFKMGLFNSSSWSLEVTDSSKTL